MNTISIKNWNRREHFEFFSQFDEPFFCIVAHVDCSKAYNISKERGYSFFAWYLHKSLVAVNHIPEFKYRIEQDNIVVYDTVHASPTLGRDDGTFGFGFIEYNLDFEVFSKALFDDTARVQSFTGLGLNEDTRRVDTVHYSSIPWFNFTGLTHARNFKYTDSVPKISFGKAQMQNGKFMMPVAVNCHHGLLDGLHVARFLEIYQELLDGQG